MKAIRYQLKTFNAFVYTFLQNHWEKRNKTNTGQYQETISIVRANGVEAYKNRIYSLKIMNIINYALFQRH